MINIADSHIHIRHTRFDEVERLLNEVADMGVTDACLLSLPEHGAAENLAALYWKMRYKRMNGKAAA